MLNKYVMSRGIVFFFTFLFCSVYTVLKKSRLSAANKRTLPRVLLHVLFLRIVTEPQMNPRNIKWVFCGCYPHHHTLFSGFSFTASSSTSAAAALPPTTTPTLPSSPRISHITITQLQEQHLIGEFVSGSLRGGTIKIDDQRNLRLWGQLNEVYSLHLVSWSTVNFHLMNHRGDIPRYDWPLSFVVWAVEEMVIMGKSDSWWFW